MKNTIEYMRKSGMLNQLQSTLNVTVKQSGGAYGEKEKNGVLKAFKRIFLHEISEDRDLFNVFFNEAMEEVFNEMDLKPSESLTPEEEFVSSLSKLLNKLMED